MNWPRRPNWRPEILHQEDPAVPVERPADPVGDRQADGDVDSIGHEHEHCPLLRFALYG